MAFRDRFPGPEGVLAGTICTLILAGTYVAHRPFITEATPHQVLAGTGLYLGAALTVVYCAYHWSRPVDSLVRSWHFWGLCAGISVLLFGLTAVTDGYDPFALTLSDIGGMAVLTLIWAGIVLFPFHMPDRWWRLSAWRAAFDRRE